MRLNATFLSLAAAVMLLFGATSAVGACTAAATGTATVGPFSPNAIGTSVATYTSQAGGFGCATGGATLTLFGSNYLKATISNAGGYKLTQAGTSDTVTFALAAKSDGTTPLSGTTAFYINGTSVDVLGLTGSIPTSVPIYIKPSAAAAVKAGTYTGGFRVTWDWWFCPSVNVSNLCIGIPDTGSKYTDVTLNVTVTGVAPTISTVVVATWDDQNGTSNPKAIPGSKRRMTVTVGNPDIAIQDSNVVAVVVATPSNTTVALDGDGTSSAFATFTEGSPASGLAFSYVSGTSTSDDVEFSSDNGSTWTFAPTAATQTSVTHVRLKTRGAMAAKSNFTFKLAYKVK